MDTPGALARPLANVGPGPDPVSIATLARETGVLVVLFHRDHFCRNCRSQVQSVAQAYDQFRAVGADVASVLPEPLERATAWQDRYALPFPLLADPETVTGDGVDQPVRFGPLGQWSDYVGRMPAVSIFDARGGSVVPAWTHRGGSTYDRPAVEELLERVEALPAELAS